MRSSSRHAARHSAWKTGLLAAMLLLAAGVLFAGPTPARAANNTIRFGQNSYPVQPGATIQVSIVKTGTTTTVAEVIRIGGTAVAGVDFDPIVTPLPQFPSLDPGSDIATINVTALPGATVGRTLTLGFGTGPGSPNDYTVTAPSTTTITITTTGPVVTSVVPSSGPVGTPVTISGSGFIGALCSGVKFGGTPVGFCDVNPSGTIITTTAPVGPSGTVPVTVTANLVTSVPAGSSYFTYTGTGSVLVTGVFPGFGSVLGGTPVTITGSGLAGFSVAVNFSGGGTTAPCTSVIQGAGGFSLTCITGAHAAGQTDVTVTVDGVPSVPSPTASANDFTYQSTGATITSVSPPAGSLAGGYLATIHGSGLAGASTVLWGGVNTAISTTPTDTALTVLVPSRLTPGPVDIQVVTPSGNSNVLAGGFYYTNGPVINGISPAQGNTGTVVEISGSGFVPGQTQVFFGETQATPTFVNASTISVPAPARGPGAVTVRVRVNGVDSPATPGSTFTYILGGNVPIISSVSPAQGTAAGGTGITITGTGFQNVNALSFSPVGGGTPTTIPCASAGNGIPPYNCTTHGTLSTITLIQPPLPNGQYHILVTSTTGTSVPSSSDLYLVGQVPVITSLDPTSGPASGDNALFVTIRGQNFCSAATDTAPCPAGSTSGLVVRFGTVTVPSDRVILDNRTQIRVLGLPAGAVGPVRVTVTTALGGTSPAAADNADIFTYVSGCTGVIVNSVTPNNGPLAGGNSVTISGCGFTGVTSVKFGTATAVITGTKTDTSLTVTVPAGAAAGKVEVTVTTPLGTNVITGAQNDYTYNAPPQPEKFTVTIPFVSRAP